MNMFSDIFCFDWYQICNNLNLRITERRLKIEPANFNAKWAAVSCVTSPSFLNQLEIGFERHVTGRLNSTSKHANNKMSECTKASNTTIDTIG